MESNKERGTETEGQSVTGHTGPPVLDDEVGSSGKR